MTRIEKISLGACLCFSLMLLAAAGTKLLQEHIEREEAKEAYIIVPEGMAMANFRYQDLPMKECAWCGRTVNLNRHHVYSQLAWPERRDDPSNIIVLDRDCHKVLGHKNNWKKFNPYVVEICDKYGGPPVDSREWREQHAKNQNSNY